MPLDRDTTYLVESREDGAALLALHPTLTERAVEWFDTVRDRGFHVEAVEEEGEVTTVKTTRGRTYRFRPLTLELYREKVKHRVDGHRDFSSTEALQRFYARLPG